MGWGIISEGGLQPGVRYEVNFVIKNETGKRGGGGGGGAFEALTTKFGDFP